MYAVVSDIHSNLEALTTVMEDIEKQGITRILCLGDVVGYGPDPVACIDIARSFEFILRGNHEEAVLNGAFGFNPVARAAVDWTRDQLKPQWYSLSSRRARWDLIKDLPLTKEEGNDLYVHGSPRDPTMEYILKSDCEDFFGETPTKIREIFELMKGACYVGHTHFPGVITEEARFYTPLELGMKFHLEEGRKYIVNIGSVGQPRDGDNRSCYLVVDGQDIEWRRLEYDHIKTAKKISNIGQLDDRNGERLQYGT
jgi:diadenosine tetraphosphatase ApaH/serine/threonine PP2A family protein phosphatase